ncbi:MAG: tRNA uridine-5-carboxymethylaminomethyl(34) synthesis GTPase MnmE [Bacteroidia bacterium]|nr:tRNA uridine-5-carboxymethylaminomethyl(34) synthesis GTPase MnmE [Bacteroidia bacterium]
MSHYSLKNDTIIAIATPHGQGAVAMLRLSGQDALYYCTEVFKLPGKKPVDVSVFYPNTIHYGEIWTGEILLDEVMLAVYKEPKSYTGEDVVEIFCHGSLYIQQELLMLFTEQGARLAEPGEFTFRGFMNGKFDLSQAEAVADLIASHSATSHQVAMSQVRGGFSQKISVLRENLVNFASLVELELDFSEEDVEFADRGDLKNLVESIIRIIQKLADSFEMGNVIKNGIPVVIVGKPNAGKSTLLNALLEEEKAIVSELPGTTRDVIEDEMIIDGVVFRFMDTAGIRESEDEIERLGVQRTFAQMERSTIVIYLFDVREVKAEELKQIMEEINDHTKKGHVLLVGNKMDLADEERVRKEYEMFPGIVFISAREKSGLDELKMHLVNVFDTRALQVPETVVTNVRHVQALRAAGESLHKVSEGLNQQRSGELLASDIRTALHQLGLITGEVSTEELLDNIFGKFCIGK